MHSTTSLHAAPAAWRMPPLVKASVACHFAACIAVLAVPAWWPWALGALAIDHALIVFGGLWPRAAWLGDNLRRLPEAAAARGEVSITLDDGPDPIVTPAVLDLLDAHDARATFFCIARQAERHPELCREIIRRGHSVQNHSHRHVHTFSLLGPRAFAREVDAAQDALGRITGHRPGLFRAPAGLRNIFLAPVLHQRSMQLVSWTRRGFDTATSDAAKVLARLTRGLAAGDILLLHDAGSTPGASGRPVVLEVLPELLRRIEQAGLRTVTLPQALLSARAETHAGVRP